ncbi:MAG: hypothetical protein PHH09_03965 [Methanoregulaceae archaeon]|nr:hypothetical protein [Methanoregulaceae archaeon]
MPLEAKGVIKFEPGAKKELIIKAPTLSIEEEVGETDAVRSLPALVDLLEKKIQKKVQEEFARPVIVGLVGYSLSCTYVVEPITNRTLDEFNLEKEYDDLMGKMEGRILNEADDTPATITFPDGKSIETSSKRIALAGKILEKARETGMTPEEVLAAAKEKIAVKGGGG